jgi:hypothetical protein
MSKVLAVGFLAVQLAFASSAFAGAHCTQQGSCERPNGTPTNSVSATEPATALAVGLGLAGAAFLRRRT